MKIGIDTPPSRRLNINFKTQYPYIGTVKNILGINARLYKKQLKTTKPCILYLIIFYILLIFIPVFEKV